ncbi:caspase family protein [Streptomyces sp. NPDC051940]|uniref:caspase family protein n=1 Tax=Streptomyces sp. NPDC051940 TaxID=3155675 RepID=UPI00343FF556
MDSERHALLVGVPEQTEPGFPRKSVGDPVREDLRLMREALEASGYDCTVLGSGSPDECRRDAVEDAFREALRAVPAGGVLLVYFSGHGLHLNGKDYLAPSNAKGLADGSVDVPSLIDLDRSFFSILGETGCAAALVLACFDACRDGSEAEGIRPFHYRAPEPTQLVVANSCAPGGTSGYDKDGSHFTKALAHAFHPDSPHRTLQQVGDSVKAQLRGRDQDPKWSPPGELPDVVVAEAGGIPEWPQAVADAEVWKLPSCDAPELQDELRARVESAVRALSGKYRKACERLPHPWRDDGYPVRVVNAVAGLPAGTRPLSALEKALLCGMPFVLATALAEEFASTYSQFKSFRDVDAAQVQNVLTGHGFSTLEENRVRRLHARGHRDEAWALTTWRLLQRRSNLRIGGSEALDHLTDCVQRLTDVVLRNVPLSHQKQLRTVVDQLARHHLSYPSCTALETYAGSAIPIKVTPHSASQLNDPDLAARWSLAAALAVDVRELSEMIGEHIGTMYPVQPEEVLLSLADANRHVQDAGLALEVYQCPHGAIHKALEEHATRCRDALGRLDSLNLPAHLTWIRSLRKFDASVYPAIRAYELPLLTFQFDQRAVSHLLMGEQLYGDPALALRELYQNALDACRYRDYRYQWAKSTGGGDPDWDGEILITQYQQDGRTVIECLDNGVGMTEEQLKDLFARTGRRLSDSSAFQHELGEWQQAGIEARFNSRFGIGVLSYFMLADEITVVTRPTDPRGQSAGEALQADIVGTATLFRISPARHDNGDAGKVQHGGTLVRLYLSADQEVLTASGVSASRTLGDLLWYTDFATEVRDELTGHHVVWEKRKLRIPDDEEQECATVDGTDGELWWVDGEGRLLADGIATAQRAFGCVVNIRDQRDLKLSVSRNEVQSWNRRKVADLITAHLHTLSSWQRVTLSWLWRFGQSAPELGDELLRIFAERPLRVERARPRHNQAEEASPLHGRTYRISDIGWCPFDFPLLTRTDIPAFSSKTRLRNELRGWRSVVLGQSDPNRPRYPRVRPALGLTMSNEGGSYSELQSALSPHSGTEALTVLSKDASAADWFLHSGFSGFSTAIGWPQPGLTEDIWLPVENSDRAILGWRRTLLGAKASLTVPDGMTVSTDMARVIATQSLARLRSAGAGFPAPGPWPWQHIVAVAAAHRIPLGRLWEEFSEFPPSWFGPLPELPAELAEDAPPTGDANWYELTSARREGLLGPKGLRDWAERYEALGVPLHIERLLGFLRLRADLTPAEQRLADLLLRGDSALGRGLVSRSDVVHAAAVAQVPLSDVIAVASRMQGAMGLSEVPSVVKGELRAPAWLADVMILRVEGDPSGSRRRLAAQSMSGIGRIPRDQVERGLEVLRELGVECPEAPAVLDDLRNRGADAETWALARGAWIAIEENTPTVVDTWEIDAGRAMWFAARLGINLGEALDKAAAVSEDLGIPVTVRMPESLRGHTIAPALWTAMNSGADLGRQSPGERPRLTPLSLARMAYYEGTSIGEALQCIEPFRELVVNFPDLDDAARRELLRHKPTEDDLWALSEDRDGSHPATPTDITPLTVVHIALRLGRTPQSVYRMYAAYRPFGLTLDFPEPDETEVPRWEDPIILSFAGDGQEPALEGAVSERRIAWCAQAVGRPGETEWARERLRLYAPMFGLEIPEPPQTEEDV